MDHMANLRSVFMLFQEFDLKFKPKICELFQSRVEFLGCRVSQNGVEKGDQYITAVQEWATPGNVKDNEKFLGFTKYHRGFIAGYAQLAVPLYKLTSKKPFVWGAEQEVALNALWKAFS